MNDLQNEFEREPLAISGTEIGLGKGTGHSGELFKDESEKQIIKDLVSELYDQSGKLLPKETIELQLSELANRGCDISRPLALELPEDEFTKYIFEHEKTDSKVTPVVDEETAGREVSENEKHNVEVPLRVGARIRVRTASSYIEIINDDHVKSGLRVEVYDLDNRGKFEQDLEEKRNVVEAPGVKPIIIDLPQIKPEDDSITITVSQEHVATSVEELNPPKSLAV